MIVCANRGCKNKFNPKTHNQKYCSDDCCKIATNRKIKEKNSARLDRLAGKKRVCKNKGCGQKLGRYQEDNTCNVCQAKEREKDRQDILRMLNGISI